MNLKPSASKAAPPKTEVSIPNRDFMNLKPAGLAPYLKISGFQSLIGIL